MVQREIMIYRRALLNFLKNVTYLLRPLALSIITERSNERR